MSNIELLTDLYYGNTEKLTKDRFEDLLNNVEIEEVEGGYAVAESGICDLVDNDILIDQFDKYELQSEAVKAICDKWEDAIEDGLEYEECKEFLSEVNKVGYTFAYGPCGGPIGLVKTPTPFKFEK